MNHAQRFLVLTSAVLAVGVSSWTVAAADPDLTPSPSASPPEPTAITGGQLFTLDEGATAVVDDSLTVMFVGVLEDSRCPTGVECVWEGNAAIELEVGTPSNLPETLCLNTNPRFETTATYANYVVQLAALDPYPTMSTTREPFRATLVVNADTGADDQVPSGELGGCTRRQNQASARVVREEDGP